MISPWTAHRNELLWSNADRFDPERFNSDAKGATDADLGTHMSFGVGPRVCIGASFALTEAILIIARLATKYQFTTIEPEHVRPVARLTTRPATEVQMHVTHRPNASNPV